MKNDVKAELDMQVELREEDLKVPQTLRKS